MVSKTGDQDSTLHVDSKLAPWLDRVLPALHSQAPEASLWTFSYAEYLTVFQEAAKTLGVPGLVPYQLRHSGASADRLANHRSLLSIMKRGRWKSLKSVNRYEKSAKMMQAATRYPAGLLEHGQRCLQYMENIVTGAMPPLQQIF